MVTLIIRNKTGFDKVLQEHPNIIKGRELTGNYLVLQTEEANIPATLTLLGLTFVDAFSVVVGLMGREALDASGISAIQTQPYMDLRGHGVLLGFVDTGIDYTQPAFKYEDNTSKIQYIWDQSIAGPGPGTFAFGTEYSNAQINEALKAPKPLDIVPHADTVGHGTFIASVAGSREEGEYLGAAPDAEIIMVKLRKASPFYLNYYLIPPEQENAFQTADVMLGIEYILEKANELGRPVAICISLGTNQAGHDGFTLFEEYISRISHETGVAVCAAAGNESNAGHHASGIIAKTGDLKEVEINVVDNSADIFSHVMTNASDKVSVSVISPMGEMIGRVPAKNGAESTSRLVFERATVSIFYAFPIEGSGSQASIIKILDPTPGIWKIQIHGDIVMNGKYDVWLPITGFVTEDNVFLTPDPDCTIVVPASATGVIACGSYNPLDNSIAASSSWGPTRLPAIMPDLASPGMNVKGVFPTGYGVMNGTSVAAAITAGACALLLQWGIVNKNELQMDTYLIRANLIRGCVYDPGTTHPNNQWGYGRMDLQNTFRLMRVI